MALIRLFVPARDFARSIAFYQAIGFALDYRDDDLAILTFEGAGLLLQNYDAPGFADNAMHQLFVSALDQWWERTADVVHRFGVKPPVAPVEKPWGLRVGFLYDPSGVLWQVSEEAH
ncbi:VOC family protein [Sphingomonas bacterium]|uniref:VOC family protein n=1 Tax=Sphingomonas bacterium TaxID=1895847 RepID=UPI001576E9A5|nr:VOC family protein [Sphingomonas bacterium]